MDLKCRQETFNQETFKTLSLISREKAKFLDELNGYDEIVKSEMMRNLMS